jgi:hypothetical protein
MKINDSGGGLVEGMRSGRIRSLIGLTILSLVLAGCGVSSATAYPAGDVSPSVCFEATAHTISGDFLHTFEVMGGVESLGYPITQPFEQEGRQVQYFEYARLEDHPDDPSGPVVKLSMLGEQLSRRRPPLAPSRVPPTFDRRSRYYSQMGHAVSGDFLTYFDENGGLDRFGFPIAEPLVVEGRLVQDFQRVRFVWHANRPPDDRVTLEPIGRVYFEAQRLDPALLAPVPCPAAVEVVR